MSTATEPSELVAYREQIGALLEAGQASDAEALARDAIAKWPDKIGLQLKLARSLEAQDRMSDARVVVEQIVISRKELPGWTRQTIAHFGYAITSGVRLDIGSDAIAGFMKSLFVTDEYERTEVKFASSVLRPHDVVLEVGGGIGFVGTYLRLADPTVTVVSYEANPSLMPVIERTKQLNRVQFETHNAMLGDRAGTAPFFANKAFWASSATHDYGGAAVIDVPVVPVEEALGAHDYTLLVMDIEGGEIDLIPTMDLASIDRFVLEVHPQITGARSVRKLLRYLKSEYGLVTSNSEDGVHLLVRQT